MIPILLSGGSGSRLWPLSRATYPKQFLAMNSEFSMFQETLRRLNGLDHQAPIVICNADHRFLAAEKLRELEITAQNIILEPMGRNTAPAIAIAALEALKQGGDPVLLVLPADHTIQDAPAFHVAIRKAEKLALEGALVTFGVVPKSPHTGYGYIKRGTTEKNGGYDVVQFVEKPDLATAETFLSSGDYLWNGGMFMFRASRYLAELEKYNPDVVTHCTAALEQAEADFDFTRLNSDAFAKCPGISIDYAVMEQTTEARVVPLDAGWSDIGSWSSLWDVCDKDDNGNTLTGDIITDNTRNSYIFAEHKLVTTIGIDELIVVDTKDALLVAHKDKSEDVKNILEELKKRARTEAVIHREVYRPWGKYDSIGFGDRDQVKRITVNPGAKLSKQMHHHRAEHWIVVKGSARVTNGEKTFMVHENESTYIPIGTVHALENPGVIPLEMIEVQSGSYLGEDDIVRFEDRYGRA
ncbi:mannose-1-phosphate guanylyltransferase/mannose-6-phosphate isomerase [Paremcibacter congregatus]|uniref:mannose-1-phosphate guanylyltransferase n=1 Tax=Paremcibacter congregatus TaxID=2043170 RepID=A0A2G4YUH5_9PROT|nr:mannose-1-phosphate guanylyltransferase/mannose-6-phosphate isomerase [Paremcibacter congregatus]PHZ85943.1 mannose-1-phosphate guanylyltransferase/mannose-6-phosphate isomerase [Paremcibacter congregatus]QDE26908.1 mannose-1-phosphate guanylyltransferase/mannose-6-phosphate isomerase [Paremcibacter congregatus]